MSTQLKKTVFVKFGGSLITNKRVEKSFRADVVKRLALEIREAITANPDIRLLIAHGSGSFGHFSAQRHNTIHGVRDEEQWSGFAEVASVAAELNFKVNKLLREADIPTWRIQPSASAISVDGVLQSMATEPIAQALDNGLVPLLYGDVSIDTTRGGTIVSTEQLFGYLVEHMQVDSMVLLGEVEGVLDYERQVISTISKENLPAIQAILGGSSGTDVTGGMLGKVASMLEISSKSSNLELRLCDGRVTGLLRDVLSGSISPGTVIKA